jgi:beta-galactosidase
MAAPMALTDVLDRRSLPAGFALSLGPWDVRVFVATTS